MVRSHARPAGDNSVDRDSAREPFAQMNQIDRCIHAAPQQRPARLWKSRRHVDVTDNVAEGYACRGRCCVMSNEEEDAKIYRERAAQARLGAKEATRPEFRAVFERLAQSYEEMARNAEWLGPSGVHQPQT